MEEGYTHDNHIDAGLRLPIGKTNGICMLSWACVFLSVLDG